MDHFLKDECFKIVFFFTHKFFYHVIALYLMFAWKLLTVTKLSSLHPKRNIFHFVESRWGIIFIQRIFRHICYFSEAFSESSQPSKMKLYKKTLNNRKRETILAKSSILHLRLSYLTVYQKFSGKDYFILTNLSVKHRIHICKFTSFAAKDIWLVPHFGSFNHYFWGSFKKFFLKSFNTLIF